MAIKIFWLLAVVLRGIAVALFISRVSSGCPCTIEALGNIHSYIKLDGPKLEGILSPRLYSGR